MQTVSVLDVGRLLHANTFFVPSRVLLQVHTVVVVLLLLGFRQPTIRSHSNTYRLRTDDTMFHGLNGL